MLLLLENTAFPVKFLLALPSVLINFFLVSLVNSELGQLQFTLLVFAQHVEFGLFALEFRFKLLSKRLLILFQLEVPFPLQSLLFLPHQIILLHFMIIQLAFHVLVQLKLVIRDVLVQLITGHARLPLSLFLQHVE